MENNDIFETAREYMECSPTDSTQPDCESVGADSISAREETAREYMECSPTDPTQPDCEIVGADSISAREETAREHMECSPTDPTQPDCESVGADSISAREETAREHMECSPTDSTQPDCEIVGDGAFDVPTDEQNKAPKWMIDLNREEYVAFRMLTARLMGPLRLRNIALLVSVGCFLMLGGFAVYEWLKEWVVYPDPVLIVGALLALVPAVLLWGYVPYRLRRDAMLQYDRSVEAGMDYYGELTVYPDCIEKSGAAVTAHIRIDERMIFLESKEFMAVMTADSPAIVLPARCATDEMARAVRQAAERIPVRNCKFLGRLQAQGEPVSPPAPKTQPEEWWVSTFTYTAEEYATVLRAVIQQHFWRMAPLLAVISTMGALFFGYDGTGTSLLHCIGYFVAFIILLMVFNLVLPLWRVKSGVQDMSAHDLTLQVRMDTMAIRMKLPKRGENLVLWCDVDHVYEREDFVEIVHNKHASLFIPKRCIDDLDALDTTIKRCRGEQ